MEIVYRKRSGIHPEIHDADVDRDARINRNRAAGGAVEVGNIAVPDRGGVTGKSTAPLHVGIVPCPATRRRGIEPSARPIELSEAWTNKGGQDKDSASPLR